jgi:signal transduction histidine kinase
LAVILRQHNEEIAAQLDQLEESHCNVLNLSEIGRKITANLEVHNLVEQVYDEVNQLMDATMFGIAIYDEDKKGLFFPGFFEQGDRLDDHYDYLDEDNRLSVHCYKQQEVILIGNMQEEVTKFIKALSDPKIGELPSSLIYMPLNYDDQHIGVITVQSFKEQAYSDYEVFLLSNLAVYVAIALENAWHYSETQQAKLVLKEQKEALERSNRDMMMLSEIGKQVTSNLEIKSILRDIRQHVQELLKLDTFSIGIFNPKKYTVDYLSLIEGDKSYPEFSYSLDDPYSLSAWVFKEHQEVLMNNYKEDFKRYFPDYPRDDYNIKAGNVPGSIMIIPLITPDKLIGVISIHGTEPNVFTKRDLSILRQIASYIAIAISNAESYRKLDATVKELKSTRDQLVLSEKMSLVGQLTAGVAHEINTPIGIGVSAASHLKEETEKFLSLIENNQLTRRSLVEYIQDIEEGSQLILSNLDRAATLVKSFKDVAVDQHNEISRTFELKAYLQEILNSLKNEFKRAGIQLLFICEQEILIHSYPGALAQIITNFAMNAIRHGLQDVEKKQITLNVKWDENNISIQFADNGKGIPEDIQEKIFEPFYTTNRNQGGTGLGLHIVYNLVTQRLNGKITVASKLHEGSRFDVVFPIVKPIDESIPRSQNG